MKKYKKLILVIFILAILILTISTGVVVYNIGYDKGFRDNQPIAKDYTPIVYITSTGSKYHLKNCTYLKSSIIQVSTKQAKELGCSPCSKCRPNKGN